MKDRAKKRKFNRKYRPQLRLGKYSLGFLVLFLVFIISIFYLSQSNKMSVKGYDIEKFEKEKQELMEERERLEIEASRLQSIKNIQVGLEQSEMVPVKKINYIRATSTIALNR